MIATIGIFCIYGLPAFILLVPFEAKRIKKDTVANGRPIASMRCLWIARVGVSSALAVGTIIGGLVMFGPSLITADFLGLAWFTWMPAIILGMWSASLTSRFVSRKMIERSTAGTEKGPEKQNTSEMG